MNRLSLVIRAQRQLLQRTALVLPLLLLLGPLYAQVTPQEAIVAMGRGINLGNTLDAPFEGDWAPVAQEYYFDAYVEAGFTCVRVPITWQNHQSATSPFTVDPAFMDRVEQVIDWGLSRGLYVVMNAHHEEWLKSDYDANIVRFEQLWTQILERFKDKPDRLLFEMINEPHPLEKGPTDEINRRILQIIRSQNPTRIVVFSGQGWSNSPDLLDATIPDDDYLIGYFHSYDPWPFAGEHQGTWGTQADRQTIANKFLEVSNWSTTHNIPVFVGEFGCRVEADYNSRMLHYATYVQECINNGFAYTVWDDYGWFKVYERNNDEWDEVKDILIHYGPEAPTNLDISVEEGGLLVSWETRSTSHDSIVIQRKGDNGFVDLATLDASATQYLDESVESGTSYVYRVKAVFTDSKPLISYTRKQILLSERASFPGNPMQIPGTIEAEDYDIGGEGFTFHDTDEVNQGGSTYRNDGVDIEDRNDGGYHIGYVDSGEWLEYSVDVAQTGQYDFTALVASMEGGGKFSLRTVGESNQVFIDVPSTGDWQSTIAAEGSINLNQGSQVLRLEIISVPPFNLDKINFNLTVTGFEDLKILPYPNPTNGVVHLPKGLVKETVLIYQLSGKLLEHLIPDHEGRLDVGHLEPGHYIIQYADQSGRQAFGLVIE